MKQPETAKCPQTETTETGVYRTPVSVSLRAARRAAPPIKRFAAHSRTAVADNRRQAIALFPSGSILSVRKEFFFAIPD
jgi:hypothetical protein